MELVTANHDFTAWYKEVADKKLIQFSKFHAFVFKVKTEEEKSLHEFGEYDIKVL